MQRQPFEFEDFSWFPDTIRRSMVDYLSFFLRATNFYKPIVPVLADCLQHTSQTHITDLCSGGGGPILQIQDWLEERTGRKIPVTLTDKFPNTEAYEYINRQSGDYINYSTESVDATAIPPQYTGVRTMFSAFHHFPPHAAAQILKDAVVKRQPIAIFDGGDKHIFAILGLIIIHPILFFFCTPFFKPFRLSRLLFTYLTCHPSMYGMGWCCIYYPYVPPQRNAAHGRNLRWRLYMDSGQKTPPAWFSHHLFNRLP